MSKLLQEQNEYQAMRDKIEKSNENLNLRIQQLRYSYQSDLKLIFRRFTDAQKKTDEQYALEIQKYKSE